MANSCSWAVVMAMHDGYGFYFPVGHGHGHGLRLVGATHINLPCSTRATPSTRLTNSLN